MVTDPVCVRQTATIEEAELVAAWLEDSGVSATVVGQESLGVHAFGVTDRDGVHVLVADEPTAERAAALLLELDKQHPHSDGAASPEIEVKCEECGYVGMFAPDQRGSVEQCTECGGYIDVPEEP